MGLMCRRYHFFEINDQPWFPQYLREKVQSCLTVFWQLQFPVLQAHSPANLVTNVLYRVLSSHLKDYTYIDFCAGAGGPTPFIEKDINARILSQSQAKVSSASGSGRSMREDLNSGNSDAVQFVLTDLHPHIPDWTEAAKRSENLTFVPRPVDATNAPADLTDGRKKVFRLFNLAFHHFEDPLAKEILRNSIETSDGFGIYELQERTVASIITIFLMGICVFLISPYYFWRSPGHLFFTYVIPIVPFVLVFDGIVSSLRTRSSEEVQALMKECGADCDGWVVKDGREQHTWPTGYMTWVMGIKA